MKLVRVDGNLVGGELKAVVDLVKKGVLFVYPTDTVYGLGCSIHSESVNVVFEIKNRSRQLPLSVAFSSLEMVKRYAIVDAKQETFIIERLDMPYTFIVRKREVVPDIVTSGKDTVGVRIPNNEVTKRIIEGADTPIITTSANLSGKSSPVSVDDIDKVILGGVSLVVDAGPCRIGRPSKVVDLVEDKIIRE